MAHAREERGAAVSRAAECRDDRPPAESADSRRAASSAGQDREQDVLPADERDEPGGRKSQQRPPRGASGGIPSPADPRPPRTT